MKQLKLYNLVFPTFILTVLSPLLLMLTLVGNFVFDSLVIIIISLFIFKKVNKYFYRETVFLCWFFGLVADFFGVIYLSVMGLLFSGDNYQGTENVWRMITSGIHDATSFSHFDSLWGVLFIVSGIIVAAVLIFVFNYFITFKRQKISRVQRIAASIAVAVFTAPYTFLLPKEWFV